MLRKLFLVTVGLAVLLMNIPSQVQLGKGEISREDNFLQAQKVFASSGMIIQDIKLQAWGQISNMKNSLEEMEEKYGRLARCLGLDEGKKAIQVEKDGFISISHLEIRGDETWQLSIQSIPMDPEEGETYLGLLCITSSPARAQIRYNALVPLLRDMGLAQEPAVVFTGFAGGRLEADSQRELAQNMALVVGGGFVEGVAEGDLTSLSFYNGDDEGFIVVNGRRINLNIALKYNPLKNSTYLHVGVPLINCDY